MIVVRVLLQPLGRTAILSKRLQRCFRLQGQPLKMIHGVAPTLHGLRRRKVHRGSWMCPGQEHFNQWPDSSGTKQDRFSPTCTRSQYLRSGTLGTSGDPTPHRRSADDDVTDRVCVHPLFRVSGRRQCCVRKTAMEKFGIFYFSRDCTPFCRFDESSNSSPGQLKHLLINDFITDYQLTVMVVTAIRLRHPRRPICTDSLTSGFCTPPYRNR